MKILETTNLGQEKKHSLSHSLNRCWALQLIFLQILNQYTELEHWQWISLLTDKKEPNYIFFFFLYFICFWVFTVFTSMQDTSQISTCINLHYTTLLHKENTKLHAQHNPDIPQLVKITLWLSLLILLTLLTQFPWQPVWWKAFPTPAGRKLQYDKFSIMKVMAPTCCSLNLQNFNM